MKNHIKFFLLLILSVLTLNTALSQNSDELPYATVYLVGAKTNDYLNNHTSFQNQKFFTIPANGVVQYKIYSEGEITITCEYALGAITGTKFCNLTVKRGNEYYVYCEVVRGWVANVNFSVVTKDKVQKILDKPATVIKLEEDINYPINSASLKDLKKGGKGQGSCFLINAEGYLVTNFHCIENAKEITVRGIEGDYTTKYGAVVVASDPSNDLALLKIQNKNLKFNAPVFGLRSSGISQAEKVYALGYPKAEVMGQEIKVTEGIISAKSGAQGDVSKFQISAAVNPGNSGGTLVDENGNLIGVIYAKSTVAEAAGYAIKASYLEAFLKNIDNFNYTPPTNTIQSKPLSEKIKELKNFIFIVETN